MSYTTDKCLERVYGSSIIDTDKTKDEDGTASDLGAIPTGHKGNRTTTITNANDIFEV